MKTICTDSSIFLRADLPSPLPKIVQNLTLFWLFKPMPNPHSSQDRARCHLQSQDEADKTD